MKNTTTTTTTTTVLDLKKNMVILFLSSCDIGESGIGPVPASFLDSKPHAMLLLVLLFVTTVVSHIQRIGCQPEKKLPYTGWPIPLVVC